MKKSQLRKLIRESINELMTEQTGRNPFLPSKSDLEKAARIINKQKTQVNPILLTMLGVSVSFLLGQISVLSLISAYFSTILATTVFFAIGKKDYMQFGSLLY